MTAEDVKIKLLMAYDSRRRSRITPTEGRGPTSQKCKSTHDFSRVLQEDGPMSEHDTR